MQDIFLRLLTAIFAARPAGGFIEATSHRRTGHRGSLVMSLLVTVPKLQLVLDSSDRVTGAVNNISANVVSPAIHAKSYPENVSMGILQLLLSLCVASPGAKAWKKDVSDAFSDARFFKFTRELVEEGWVPVLRKWALSDTARLPDLLSHMAAPTTAGIMFGVGASAARTDADRKTQTSLRRVALLLLACDTDAFMSHVPLLGEKLSELCTATPASSPSAATRAEMLMVCRALVLSITSTHLAGIWPLMNDVLQAALTSAIPGGHHEQETYNNLSLLQACKLLDLLTVLRPDEFQVHEWVYLTNTIDAVYRPDDWTLTALVDEVAEALGTDGGLAMSAYGDPATPSGASRTGMSRPFLGSLEIDGRDIRAMARDEFVRTVLRPFFAQLSMYAYENTYGMGVPDTEACRRDLLGDVLDESTIV